MSNTPVLCFDGDSAGFKAGERAINRALPILKPDYSMNLVFMPEGEFELGKAVQMNEGKDVSIIATGHLTWYAVEAANALEAEGISVDLINIHTIKPLDEAAVLASAARTGCVVTAEEHQILGGLGGSVAQLLAANNPCPMEFVGMEDCFGESGKPDQLLAKYKMDTATIIAKAKAVMAKK